MTRLSKLAVVLLVVAPSFISRSQAQSADPSLGDLARSLRKTQAPPRKVIDNDNLSDVMEAGVSKKWDIAGIHFSVDKNAIDIVNASSPDVTCALAFNGQPDAPKPEIIPAEDLVKIDGPATIVGDSFQVAVQNRTAWEVREITVGLTLMRSVPSDNTPPGNGAKLLPASLSAGPVPPERRSDITVLYHLKGKADAMGAGLFQDQLKLPLPLDQDWHWAVVQAKGVRPAGSTLQPSAIPPSPNEDDSTSAPATVPAPGPPSPVSPASVIPPGRSLN